LVHLKHLKNKRLRRLKAASLRLPSAHTWTPTFAKLSIDDFEKVKIAAIHPDF
jgi:hypothetical protein